jgi:hypothetical protein
MKETTTETSRARVDREQEQRVADTAERDLHRWCIETCPNGSIPVRGGCPCPSKFHLGPLTLAGCATYGRGSRMRARALKHDQVGHDVPHYAEDHAAGKG